jgi:UDP-3-O-[3-hydroxymyristoyl] glucosamine N-acyltransferase
VITLGRLAAHLGCELRGSPDEVVECVATLQSADKGALSFLSNPRYRPQLAGTRATAVLLAERDRDACPTAALVSARPYADFARAAALLNPPRIAPAGIHPSAVVSPEAMLAPDVHVGPQCVVEAGARLEVGAELGPGCIVLRDAVIGSGSRLSARVTVGERVQVGARALLHPGVVLGADGFGMAWGGERWVKVPQLGTVRLGDDVEIGANTTVDRGALGDTVIGNDVKLDNQIQIGHNVQVGDHTAMAGCVAVAGSARIGRRCIINAGVLILGHLEIADGVEITAFSLVTQGIARSGKYSGGTLLQDNTAWRRNALRFQELDMLARRVRALERTASADSQTGDSP